MKKKFCRLTMILLLITSGVQAQTLSESEPNDSRSDSGVKFIYQSTTITGTIEAGGKDFYRMSREDIMTAAYYDAEINLSTLPASVEVWGQFYNGGYNGGQIGSDFDLHGSYNAWSTSWRDLDRYSGFYVYNPTGSPISYSIEVNGQNGNYVACPDPGASGNYSTNPTSNSVTLNSFDAASNADGYFIVMNSSNSFADLAENQFELDNIAIDGTTWQNSGEQVMAKVTSNKPSLTLTGLSPNTTYYLKVYPYRECYGFFLPNNSTSSVSVTTLKTSPTLTFSNITADYGDSDITLSASTNSDGTLTYSLIGATTNTSISGSTLTLGNPGTMTIRASTAESANFTAASKDATLNINKLAGTVTLGNLSQSYDGGAKSASATTSPDAFTVNLTYNGSSTAPTNAGSYTVVGTINDTFYQGSSSGTLIISKADQTISFSSLANQTFGESNFDLGATASSGNSVTYTSSNSSVASISGNTVTIVGAGTTDITASQSGDGNYNAASNVIQSLTVNKASQVITFGDLADRTVGDSDFTIGATSSSGLGVSFQSLDETIATVSGNIVSIQSAGTVTIRASQSGNDNYLAAGSVDKTLTINEALTQVAVTSSVSGICTRDVIISLGSIQANVDYYLMEDGTTDVLDGPISGSSNANISFDTHSTTSAITYLVRAESSTQSLDMTTKPSVTISSPTNQSVSLSQPNTHTAIISLAGSEVGLNYFLLNNSTSAVLEGPVAGTGSGISFSTQDITANTTYKVAALEGNTYNASDICYFEMSSTPTATFSEIEITNEVTFNAPASLAYDGSQKAFTVSVDGSISSKLTSSNLDITYEGRNGTSYISSSTAPTEVGDYTVIATVQTANAFYYGSISTDFRIAPEADLSGFVNFSATVNDSDVTLSVPSASGVNIIFTIQNDGGTEASLSGTNGETLSIGSIGGSVTIRASVDDPSYDATFKDITLTINKLNPVVSWNLSEVEYYSTYGADQLNAISDIEGTFSYYDADYFYDLSGAIEAHEVGTSVMLGYSFTPANTGTYNYVGLQFITVSVVKANLEITAHDTTFYIDQTPQFNYSFTAGSVNPTHGLNVPLNTNYSGTAGTYQIFEDGSVSGTCGTGIDITYEDNSGGGGGGSGRRVSGDVTGGTSNTVTATTCAIGVYYNSVTFIEGTLTIIDKTGVTIALNSSDLSTTYDGQQQSVGIASVTANASGSTVSPATNVYYEGRSGTTYAKSTTAPTLPGYYSVTAEVDASDPDHYGTVSADMTINKAPLTITVNPQTITYGQNALLGASVSYDGFIGSDTEADLIGTLEIYDDVSYDAVGTYSEGLYADGLSSTLYDINYVAGDLVVNPAALTITASSHSITYGDVEPVYTFSYDGFQYGEGDEPEEYITEPSGVSLDRTFGDAGTYSTQVNEDASANNYAITYVDGVLVVNKAEAIVSISDAAEIYDGSGQTPTATTTPASLVVDYLYEGINGTTYAQSSIAPSNVGEYEVTAAINETNYTGSNSATLTINPMALLVAADAKSKTYGDVDPELTYSIVFGNLANGDAFSGSLTRVAGENVGTYAITQDDLTAGPNYDITYDGELLSVTKKALTISGNNRTITYGDNANSGNTVSYAGFIVGESSANLSGALVFTNITQTDAGTYNGVIIPSGLTSSNYEITFESGDLTITPASATITITNLSHTYDGTPKEMSISTDPADLNLLVDLGEPPVNAGSYPFTVTIDETNYSGSKAATLIINKAPQSINFSSISTQNRVDNSTLELSASTNAGLSVSYASSDDLVATVDGSTLTFHSAGYVDITASQSGNANYEAAENAVQGFIVTELYVWDGAAWNETPPSNVDLQFDGDFTITSDMITSSVVVSPGATLTINTDVTLTDNNEVNNEGTIIVKSGGSLITFGDVYGSNYQIERTTTFDNQTGKYSMVGSPVVASSFDVLSSNWVFGYDETEAYHVDGNEGADRFKTPFDLGQTTMQSGQGYFSAYTGDENGLVTFVGTPNTGDVTVDLTFTDQGDASEVSYQGFNLVSNPYPSAIGFTSFMEETTADITGSIYLWDDYGSDTERGTNADYLIVNAMGNTDSRGGADAKWDGYIRSGQGFFVQANSSTSLTFTDAMRQEGNNTDGGYYRLDQINAYKLIITDGQVNKATVFGYASDATLGADKSYDAMSLNGGGLQVYTLQVDGEQKLGIQGLPANYKEGVKLGYSTLEAGEFTIMLSGEVNESVILFDKLLDQEIDLSSGSYTFSSQLGDYADRFVLMAPEVVTGIDRLKEIRSYSTDGYLHLLSDEPITQGSQYQLIDLMGRSLIRGTVNRDSNKVDIYVGDLPRTVYILQLIDNKSAWRGKVILK